MKVFGFLLFGLIFTTLVGCNRFKADHPQANLSDENKTTDLTAQSILVFKDSIDKNLSQFDKKQSLVFMLGDLSFYVEQYGDSLFVEHAYNGAESNSIKRYYFRNDSLILYQTGNELVNEDGVVFKEERTYLRNHTVFRKDGRTATSAAALKSLPYIDISLSENADPDKSYLDNVNSLKSVLNGVDKFDMVFESIRTYPDSRYITLRSKEPNSYTASILVKERDNFIDSLLNYPILFKDKKLNFNWEVVDREAVYVPVSSNTSASGLNK
ncbi:hypothetical protein WG904_03320 [Pedobacter sp. Du54]|uniref:hypothetical protein n=1 Tax=Pedobacter anseongensis TaxID=3133439 RepID=UPI0030B242F9